jgi:hypothetical protein
MVLSNAERQARYRKRIKKAAEQGVTPEMVLTVARLAYEKAAKDEPGFRSWAEYVGDRRTRKVWTFNLPDDPEADYSEFGDNPEMFRKVAAVVRAVTRPPDAG